MDPWHVDRLDLDAYLARIGVPARPPTRAALDELHEAHVRAFTFDNVDVLLDQHPGVDLDAVSAKFVGRGRGGYCFEHATLVAAALTRLGYDVTRRLGRVGDPATAPRTHAVVHVRVDGETVLADPGFGMSPLRTVPLHDGAEVEHGGWRHRVTAVDDGGVRAWALSRWRDEQWELMHTHDELPVRPVDVTVGHHWTSTVPTSHFRSGLMVTSYGDGRHTSLTDRTLTVRRPGEPTEHREIDVTELRDLLHGLGVPLGDDEGARLVARVEQLRAQDWVERLWQDEGAPGARVVLDALAEPAPGRLEIDLNVWQVTVDRDAGTVHVAHCFDPDEGRLGLEELVRGLGSRLA